MPQHLKSLPEPPIDPPEAAYREIQDEESIRVAIGEADELMSSLAFLDRHDLNKSHFIGDRGVLDRGFDGYRALRIILKDLIELLGEYREGN